jgi:hypothetical protein
MHSRHVGVLLAGALFAGGACADHMVGLPKTQAHQEVPLTVKQVEPDLYFHYNDASSNSAFQVTEEGVLVVDSGQHPADLTGTAMSAVNGQERTRHLKAAIPRYSHAAVMCM